METTRNNTIWWWVAGIVVLALIVWAVVANMNNAGIPNTGVDTASSTNMVNGNTYLNASSSSATSTGNPTVDNAKG